MSALERDLERELLAIETASERRSPITLDGAQGPVVRVGDRHLLCFVSNNYLGLANHPDVVNATREALAQVGLGAGASRLVGGTNELHRHAEAALADYVRMPSARLFSSGYSANVGALSALLRKGDIVWSDALNHASLIDGCRLSGARIEIYPHADVAALERSLREHRTAGSRALIVTESVFSMDGDRAPLRELRALADRFDAALYVDEAHALGTLGPGGRGVAAALDVRVDVLVGTLGKALGTSGAFVAGSEAITEWLLHRARSYVFSTAPPAALCAAAMVALRLSLEADSARTRLHANASRLRAGLREAGYRVPSGDTPIIPVLVGHAADAVDLANRMVARGVLVQAVRPPTVPAGTSRLRVVPMATHTDEHIATAIETFRAERAS